MKRGLGTLAQWAFAAGLLHVLLSVSLFLVVGHLLFGPPALHLPECPPQDPDGSAWATQTRNDRPVCRPRDGRDRGDVGPRDHNGDGRPDLPFPVLPLLIAPLITTLTSVGFSLVLTRRLTQPLAELTQAAEAFGQGNTRIRVTVRRRDELGTLGNTFNSMAERTETLLRNQRELVANVSHELRTPIARVRMALELAEDGVPTDPDWIRDVGADLAELESMVDTILTASRLEAGQAADGLAAFPQSEVYLMDLTEEAIHRFQRRYPLVDVDLQVPEELQLRVSPALLRRALENLLDNAAKYGAPDQPIALDVIEAGDTVEFAITNRGESLTPDQLARAFDPFFRADPSRTRSTGGVGLGLTLVKRIAEVHGGTAELQAIPEGGTRAMLRLPRLRSTQSLTPG